MLVRHGNIGSTELVKAVRSAKEDIEAAHKYPWGELAICFPPDDICYLFTLCLPIPSDFIPSSFPKISSLKNTISQLFPEHFYSFLRLASNVLNSTTNIYLHYVINWLCLSLQPLDFALRQ